MKIHTKRFCAKHFNAVGKLDFELAAIKVVLFLQRNTDNS